MAKATPPWDKPEEPRSTIKKCLDLIDRSISTYEDLYYFQDYLVNDRLAKIQKEEYDEWVTQLIKEAMDKGPGKKKTKEQETKIEPKKKGGRKTNVGLSEEQEGEETADDSSKTNRRQTVG